MPVIVVRDDAMFLNEMSNAGNNVVVIDFTASWCGPCQRIAPVFERLSNQYLSAKFLKVDVEQCESTAATYNVSAMPTFIFTRSRQQLARIQGADQSALESKLRELCATSSDGDSVSDSGVSGHIDLTTFINKSESECLNESDSHSLSGCLSSGTSTYLESDCDEQLIINLAFNQPLKLHSLKILSSTDNGPKNIKLFINQPRTLDFDQADAMEPIQKLELTPQDVSAANLVPLRFVKFQNVQNLVIFIKDNQSNSEVTRIDQLSIIGSPLNSTNMSEFKRLSGKKGESH